MNDKKTILAFVLMGLVLLVYFSTPYQKMINPLAGKTTPPDTIQAQKATPETTATPAPAAPLVSNAASLTQNPENLKTTPDTTGGFPGPVKELIVNTPNFEVHLSSLGGGTLDQVYLNNYFLKDSSRVQLIPEGTQGVLANQFLGFNVDNFSTAGLNSQLLNCTNDTCRIEVVDEPFSATFILP